MEKNSDIVSARGNSISLSSFDFEKVLDSANLLNIYKDKYKSLVEYNVENLKRDIADSSRRARKIHEAFFESGIFRREEEYLYDLFLLSKLMSEGMVLLLDRKYSLGGHGIIRAGYNFRVLGSVEKQNLKKLNSSTKKNKDIMKEYRSADERNIYCYFGIKNALMEKEYIKDNTPPYEDNTIRITYGKFLSSESKRDRHFDIKTEFYIYDNVDEEEMKINDSLVDRIVRPYFGAGLIPGADLNAGISLSSDSREEEFQKLEQRCKELYAINEELYEKMNKLKSEKKVNNNNLISIADKMDDNKDNNKNVSFFSFGGKFKQKDIMSDRDIKLVLSALSKRSLYKFASLNITPDIIRCAKTLYFIKDMSMMDISIKMRVSDACVGRIIKVPSSKIDHTNMVYKGASEVSFDLSRARDIYNFVVLKQHTIAQASKKFSCTWREARKSIEYIKDKNKNIQNNIRARA